MVVVDQTVGIAGRELQVELRGMPDLERARPIHLQEAFVAVRIEVAAQQEDDFVVLSG